MKFTLQYSHAEIYPYKTYKSEFKTSVNKPLKFPMTPKYRRYSIITFLWLFCFNLFFSLSKTQALITKLTPIVIKFVILYFFICNYSSSELVIAPSCPWFIREKEIYFMEFWCDLMLTENVKISFFFFFYKKVIKKIIKFLDWKKF